MRRNALVVIGLAQALATAASCGRSDRLPVYPVRGQVIHRGKPAVHAFVAFHPVDGSERLEALRPHAHVDLDGSFALTTYRHGDGAPVGEYRVTITWPSVPEGEDPEDPDEATGPDQLGGRYADLKKTPFTARVTEGVNQLAPFDVR